VHASSSKRLASLSTALISDAAKAGRVVLTEAMQPDSNYVACNIHRYNEH
jgi:hypothetical protein